MQQFDPEIWSYDLKINRVHLLSWGYHYSKFSIHQSIEVLNIEQTTFFQRPAVWSWPLTMWKSIGVIYSLGTSTVLSLITFKHRDQNIYWVDIVWSTDRWTNQPTAAKKYARYFQRRHKYEKFTTTKDNLYQKGSLESLAQVSLKRNQLKTFTIST